MKSLNKNQKINMFLIILLVIATSLYLRTVFLSKTDTKYIDLLESASKKIGYLQTGEEAKELNELKKSLIANNIDFYDRLKYYLEITDSLDLSMADTIQFEAKQDCYFSPYTKFVVTTHGHYVIGTGYPSKFIAIYSDSGRLIRKLGREGQGPGEYLSPAFVDFKNDTIYCYDNNLIKIILYSCAGEYITDYKLKSGVLFPKDFKISPIKNIAIFYDIYPLNQSHIISLYTFGRNEILFQELGKFGEMHKLNVVSSFKSLYGIAVSENGYIFALQPQRLGFNVFHPEGKEIASCYNLEADFFKPLKRINKNDLRDQDKLTSIYFRHSRCYSIDYLGRGVIGISVASRRKKANTNNLLFYTF